MNDNAPLVVLGVTGGIAAYKSAELCSSLVQKGFRVHVMMTANAQRFVTPLTFQTLSRNPVTCDLWSVPEWRPEHVALAGEAKLLVVAPATANALGKFANGIADDALSTFFITFPGKVLLAPAMNPLMWRNPACCENVRRLRERGVLFCGPVAGHVACGSEPGPGRMAEPDEILTAVISACGALPSSSDGSR